MKKRPSLETTLNDESFGPTFWEPGSLSRWSRDKSDAISHMTLSNVFFNENVPAVIKITLKFVPNAPN